MFFNRKNIALVLYNQYSSNCDGFVMNVVAPIDSRNSLSRKPHNTLTHGIPTFFAVLKSTSLSPM